MLKIFDYSQRNQENKQEHKTDGSTRKKNSRVIDKILNISVIMSHSN